MTEDILNLVLDESNKVIIHLHGELFKRSIIELLCFFDYKIPTRCHNYILVIK